MSIMTIHGVKLSAALFFARRSNIGTLAHELHPLFEFCVEKHIFSSVFTGDHRGVAEDRNRADLLCLLPRQSDIPLCMYCMLLLD